MCKYELMLHHREHFPCSCTGEALVPYSVGNSKNRHLCFTALNTCTFRMTFLGVQARHLPKVKLPRD